MYLLSSSSSLGGFGKGRLGGSRLIRPLQGDAVVPRREGME